MANGAAKTEYRPNYEVQAREMVAETPELRVQVITLGPDHVIPWHFHSTITDTFFCLEGELSVEARAPRVSYRLKPGERCAITPNWAHIVRSAGPGAVRFLIVQGPGAYDYIPVGGAVASGPAT
jgi:quercetin dioxygenase-like cupin family protein